MLLPLCLRGIGQIKSEVSERIFNWKQLVVNRADGILKLLKFISGRMQFAQYRVRAIQATHKMLMN